MFERFHELFDIPYRLNFQKSGDWSKHDRPVLVLIHGIGVNNKVWRKLVSKLPSTPIIAVDLLGFGNSKRPKRLNYDLRDQALAVHKTIRKLSHKRKIILCGHSLGSLVSVEYARRFPEMVEEIILCSPPIYELKRKNNFPTREAILEQVGRKFLRAVESSQRTVTAANTYGYYQKSFQIDPDNISPYVKTARKCIIEQTAIDDLAKIDIPIHIVYGVLDTVMIPANFRRLKKINPQIKISQVASGHEMNSAYTNKLVKIIDPSQANKPLQAKIAGSIEKLPKIKKRLAKSKKIPK